MKKMVFDVTVYRGRGYGKKRLEHLIQLIEGPEELKPKTFREALELSLAKWHPIRGERRGLSHDKQDHCCAICIYIRDVEDLECAHCPLCIAKTKNCFDFDHPHAVWSRSTIGDAQWWESCNLIYGLLREAHEVPE